MNGSNRFYKVVCQSAKDLEYVSVLANPALVYTTTEWTSAPPILANAGYHPTCFLDYGLAVKFYHGCNNSRHDQLRQLWCCAGEGALFEFDDLPTRISLDLFTEWLSKTPSAHNGYCDAFSDWPAGTVMVERIKLIKRLAAP